MRPFTHLYTACNYFLSLPATSDQRSELELAQQIRQILFWYFFSPFHFWTQQAVAQCRPKEQETRICNKSRLTILTAPSAHGLFPFSLMLSIKSQQFLQTYCNKGDVNNRNSHMSCTLCTKIRGQLFL